MARIRWLLLILLILLIGLWWRSQQPDYYQLLVINNSPIVVQQVSVFGDGVLEIQSIENLSPGKSQQLNIQLGSSGDLRVAVSQGLNRIDSLVARDVGAIENQRQRLTINADNRYIFSTQD